MPTDLQIAAAEILNDGRKLDGQYRRWTGALGIVGSLIGLGPIAVPIFFANELIRYNNKEYYRELEKVVRGERHTLPTPPKGPSGMR